MSRAGNRLLVVAGNAPEYAGLLQAAGLPGLNVVTATDARSALSLCGACNIILGDPPLVSAVLAAATRLEWVQSSWAGVDRLCSPGLRRDYILTGAKGVFGPLISEYVMAYLFGLERRVFAMRENQAERRWQVFGYRPARDLTMGIAGLGSIGRHLAETAAHFGIRVVGLNRSGKPCAAVEKVYTAAGLAAFLGPLDYLVLTLPATPGTRNFIAAEALAAMKPGAVLINVGRGGTVDEAALADALRSGVIGAAVLDVFADEPLPEASPLWGLSNAYITPHNAATSFAADIVGIFVENYRRFVHGERLDHVVDFESGY